MLVDNRALIRKLAELDPNKPVYFMYGKDEYVLTAIKPENLDDKVSENEKGIVIDIRETEALEEVVLDRGETEIPPVAEEATDTNEEQEEAVEETPISEDSTEEAVDTESEEEEEIEVSEEKSEETEKKVIKKSEKQV